MGHLNDERLHLETLAVHAGERRPGPEGSLVFPIYQGTVFSVEPETSYHDIKYIRLNTTPSQTYLHDKLAVLEQGEAAIATSSGMAALTSVLLSLLRSGDHLLASESLYGGTHDFITENAGRLGWNYTFVDPQAPATWAAVATSRTRVFLVETITNPRVRVPCLPQIVAFARDRRVTTVIDNTFASPVNFNPLTAGFDICCHSATKYLNGHSDLVAGCVIANSELVDRVRRTLNHLGGTLDPHAGFLLARGLKTLAVRVRVQNANAEQLATFLADHPLVAEVSYPGLASHPDHDRAVNLFAGYGGMLSFRLRHGAAAVDRFLDALCIPYIAPSLGGVETLVTVPARTSHAGMSSEARQRLGITDELVRVSCGIENAQDLVDDPRARAHRQDAR
jgi:cystathionine beta-lyase/cystathionine gamma-synthase